MTSVNKLLVVLLILCGGVGAALLFRKEHPDDGNGLFHTEAVEATRPSPAAPRGHLSLRHAADDVPSYAAEGWPTPRAEAAPYHAAPSDQAPTLRERPDDGMDETDNGTKPLHPLEPVATPTLPNQFPVAGQFPIAGRAANDARPVFGSVFFRQGRAPADEEVEIEPPATHSVVDGDTLASLAERFLGSANHAVSIYELNRDRLENPDMLPIGVELKLPSRDDLHRPEPTHAEVPAYDAAPRTQLVPIHTNR